MEIIEKLGGTAPKGDAMNNRLGELGLPVESVEGYVAHKLYRKNEGQWVFRRITRIVRILEKAGLITDTGSGKVTLVSQ